MSRIPVYPEVNGLSFLCFAVKPCDGPQDKYEETDSYGDPGQDLPDIYARQPEWIDQSHIRQVADISKVHKVCAGVPEGDKRDSQYAQTGQEKHGGKEITKGGQEEGKGTEDRQLPFLCHKTGYYQDGYYGQTGITHRAGNYHKLGYSLRFYYGMNVGEVAGQPVAEYDRKPQRSKSKGDSEDYCQQRYTR